MKFAMKEPSFAKDMDFPASPRFVEKTQRRRLKSEAKAQVVAVRPIFARELFLLACTGCRLLCAARGCTHTQGPSNLLFPPVPLLVRDTVGGNTAVVVVVLLPSVRIPAPRPPTHFLRCGRSRMGSVKTATSWDVDSSRLFRRRKLHRAPRRSVAVVTAAYSHPAFSLPSNV
jgi:hypothetical protein